jgi:hypothetical protein
MRPLQFDPNTWSAHVCTPINLEWTKDAHQIFILFPFGWSAQWFTPTLMEYTLGLHQNMGVLHVCIITSKIYEVTQQL